jgi:tetratricopeptide (TPR) repeat protein
MKRSALIYLGVSLFGALASAQQNQPPQTPGGNQPGGATPGGSQAGGGNVPPGQGGTPPNTNSSDVKTLYTEKPGQGSAGQQASDMQNMMQKRSQANESLIGIETTLPPELESFLSTPPPPPDQLAAYEKSFDDIVQLLRRRDVTKAVVSLYELSAYPWDSGISEQLGNRILAYWDMQRDQTKLLAANAELEKKIKQSAWNADIQSAAVQKSELDYQRRQNQSKSGKQGAQQQADNSGNQNNKNGGAFLPNPAQATSGVGSVMGRLRLAEDYFQTLDSRARTRINELETIANEKKARADFQGNIKTLFENGRHYHSKLAVDFYRVVMGDGDFPAALATQAAQAAEIVQRIRSDAPVIAAKVQSKRLASASQMLREDFTISRLHPALQAIPLESRMIIQDYFADLQKLQNMAEARDFSAMDKQIARMEESVVDFDATKPRAYVNAMRNESNMRLGMAKLAAQQGNLEKSMEEFKAATMAWPDNPAIAEASKEFFNKQDAMSQSGEDFDKAFAKGDYREIFDKQLQYATAVHGDKKKEGQLKQALQTVKAAEMALEKAKLLERNRDVSGAWETLELASEEWPEDSVLNKRRADLSVRASEYVKSISNAKDAEAAGNMGSSLAWFLNAQQTYPPSQIANEAIERLSDKILGKRPKLTKKSRDTEDADDDDAKSKDQPPATPQDTAAVSPSNP